MAEQEVIKHTKRIFSVWKGDKKFWHKVREFLLEIIIIVFAVSLSIYLHDVSEKKHQQHETKEFLLGLKQDLSTDIKEMEQDKKSFEQSGKAFTYITSLKMNEQPDPDSIKYYYNWIFNTTGLVPNSGRFEGFKSSGKIGTIGNKELQNNIMDLYQEDIPNVIISTNNYTLKKQALFDYVNMNQKRLTDSTDNRHEILATNPAWNISRKLIFVNEILSRYDTCINKMKLIIAEINEEYGERDAVSH
jgi:hypothetical protein